MGRLRSLIILVPVLVAACDDQGPRTPADLVVTPNMPQVPMGGTRQLTATVVDADGRAIEGEAVTFESAEPHVVTVSDGGLLSSVGSLDTVTITATSRDLAAEVQAQVVPPLPPREPEPLRLAVGEVVQLYIIVTDEHGDSIADAELILTATCGCLGECGGPGGGQAVGPGHGLRPQRRASPRRHSGGYALIFPALLSP